MVVWDFSMLNPEEVLIGFESDSVGTVMHSKATA